MRGTSAEVSESLECLKEIKFPSINTSNSIRFIGMSKTDSMFRFIEEIRKLETNLEEWTLEWRRDAFPECPETVSETKTETI